MSATAAKEETVKNLKQSTDDLQDDLHNAANQAGRKVRGMIDAAGDEVSHVSDRLTSEFQTNPLRSGVIALGVGVLLGALLRR
ncbi:MAG TPA: hypothetical protein VFW37_03095 [Alphaproteobacteria bacterium]|nr:hypothetical protein [Alphaproteobacteria bacterium]